ncbi:MAG TPA: type II toxin-antitoxin system VapC family toxin [Longimicrobium sp.]|nr:type II toxin-antitoxin system VapC family toxin [Longimicrobium sp.]
MRYYFFDTSAFVKDYAYEPGSRRVEDMIRSAAADPDACSVIVCELVLPEAFSALVGITEKPDAARRGLSRLSLHRALSDMRADVLSGRPYAMVSVGGTMERAADLVLGHRLKVGDSIQLAAALAARNASTPGSEFYLASADARLNAAAEREALPVIDPT